MDLDGLDFIQCAKDTVINGCNGAGDNQYLNVFTETKSLFLYSGNSFRNDHDTIDRIHSGQFRSVIRCENQVFLPATGFAYLKYNLHVNILMLFNDELLSGNVSLHTIAGRLGQWQHSFYQITHIHFQMPR